jgi:hypothetical protein
MSRQSIPRFLSVPDLKPGTSSKWIPLPLQLLDDYRFKELRDIDRWHYVGICLLAARCGNRLPGDAIWIGERIRASEPIDLLRLIEARLLVSAGRHPASQPGGQDANSAGQNSSKTIYTSFPTLQSRSRHDLHTLRLYAATKPNTRSVRELAGYFARTGVADEEVDVWLDERKSMLESAKQSRAEEAAAEREQHEAMVAEIMSRGGPRDDIERMICEAHSVEEGKAR